MRKLIEPLTIRGKAYVWSLPVSLADIWSKSEGLKLAHRLQRYYMANVEPPKYLAVKHDRLLKALEDDIHLIAQSINLIVNVGKNYVLDSLIANASANNFGPFTHCSVGSGTATPVVGNTDLQTPITPRKAKVDQFRINQTGTVSFSFASVDNNGTWNEAGLHTALTAGSMGSRALFSPAVTKTSARGELVDWDWAL